MNVIEIPQTASTNALFAPGGSFENAPDGTVVAAHTQTAGRGQRGNSWESEPGLNLTFSFLLTRLTLPATRQFELSMAISVGLTAYLRTLVPVPEWLTLKWPNDIYFADRKLAGILIENTLTGKDVTRSVTGIGLNVNQKTFISDAPNPISLSQICGMDFSLRPLLENAAQAIMESIDAYGVRNGCGSTQALLDDYTSMLWRSSGFHPYIHTATGRRFNARITAVAPTGHITLTEPDGTQNSYAFKEIAAIL